MSEEIKNNSFMAARNGKPEESRSVMGDPPVYYTQVWLNQKYSYHPNWVALDEDGVTGWSTIYGLVRALQIYLGIGVDGDFGLGTIAAFESRFANTGKAIVPVQYEVNDIYGIVSGALWCKGYYGSFEQEINCRIDERGSSSIISLKRDAGISTDNNHINALLLKALLSMDQFVLLGNYGGTNDIRTIQQYLNANYGEYVGIVPCDGLYQREMNRALIKVLQVVEGFSGNDVDGIFGNGTKSNLPQLSGHNQPNEAVRLFNFCLTCNGYPISETMWSTDVVTKTKSFQSKHMIPITGLGDTNTWMSLLLSKGNPDRGAIGCDCATILDATKANALFNAGYRYVGRYVSGTVGAGNNERSKALTKSEMSVIFNAGLSIFAVYQEGGVYLERYTYERGVQDAENAITAAVALDIPIREYIYFAVDYDVMDGYIEPYVVPYFQGINEVMSRYGNRYHVGIYGARNVCSKICFKFGLASSSFVSDMSTGYSGNMGYQLPDNWALDQFHEFTFSDNGVSFPLDKDAVSGQYLGFNRFDSNDSGNDDITNDDMLDAAYNMLSPIVPSDKLGNRTSFDWELGVIEFSVGSVTARASYKCSSLFNISKDNAKYGTFSINNGEIDGINWSKTDELYNSLDANFKTELGMDGWGVIFDLSRAVNNGKISIGTKLSYGKLSTYIVLEQYLGKTETTEHTVSVKFEFIIENDDDNSNNQLGSYVESTDQIEVVVAVAVVATVAAVAIVAAYAGAIVTAIVNFFTMLGSWLSLVFA